MILAKRILVAVIFAPLLFVVMFFLPPVALGVVTAFISAVACFELLRATGEGNVTRIMHCVCGSYSLRSLVGLYHSDNGSLHLCGDGGILLVCHPRL